MANVHSAVCAICGTGGLTKEKYRLWKGVERTSQETELFRQLRNVAGDALPARSQLRSNVVCKRCQKSIQTAANQKERFEQSRRALLQKVQVTTDSWVALALPATDKTPPRRTINPSPRQPMKRPLRSPMTKTGVSPLTKRYLPDTTIAQEQTSTVQRRSDVA